MHSANEDLAIALQMTGALPKVCSDLAIGQTESWDSLKKAFSTFIVSDQGEWPTTTFGDDLLIDPYPKRDIFIEGMLERGDLFSISATSKGKKSYLLHNLVLCMISGRDFLSFKIPEKRKVGLINFELKPNNLKRRLNYIVERTMPDFNSNDIVDNLFVMNLRGHEPILEETIDRTRELIQKNKLDMVLFDPLYMMLIAKERRISENDNSDMSFVLGKMNSLTKDNCTVGWTSHYTKAGGRPEMEAMNRMAGAGVQARIPDCIWTITELDVGKKDNEEAKDFRMEFTLRDFAPQLGINITWEWPCYHINEALAGTKLKGSGGRPPAYPYRILISTWNDMRGTGNSVPAAEFLDRLGATRSAIAKRLLRLNDDQENTFNFRFEGRGDTCTFVGHEPRNPMNCRPEPESDLLDRLMEEQTSVPIPVPVPVPVSTPPAPEVTQ